MNQGSDIRGIRPTAILKGGKQARQYTLEEFLRREARAMERHEFYNGIITKIPMAAGSHNIVVANISAALVNTFVTKNKPYLVSYLSTGTHKTL